MKHLRIMCCLLSVFFIQIIIPCSTSFEHSSVVCQRNFSECNDFCISTDNEKCDKEIKNHRNILPAKDDSEVMANSGATKSNLDRAPWYLRVPLLPVIFANSPTLPQGECKRQVQKYLEELNNGTLWAVRMFDASTKYPEGIITGHTRHYGNFDQCYQIGTTIENHSFKSDAEVIGGKYCLVKVEYQKLIVSNDRVGPYTLEFDPNGSVWEAIKEKGDFRRVKRYLLELALCVPDACSASDVEKALNKPLKKIGIEQNILIKIGMKGECQTHKDSREFSIWAKIYCYVILGLFLLVGVSTWYDGTLKNVEQKQNESLAVDILLCFSARRNFQSITDITCSHSGLDSIFLLRFFFMCCSIFGHRLMQYYANPMINSEFLEYTYTLPSFILLYNGPIIVESFFAFGGILLAYYMLLELDKRKKINFLAAILIRYLRFTPSYFVVIIFIALVLPHLGSGPYWEYKIGLESSSCAHNWWANLLYINNYVNTDKLCMFQSWYVSVDYHLYVIALFVIYFFWKMPRKVGYPFLIAIIITGCTIPFYLTYFYHVQPMYKGLPYMHEVREDPYFTGHYIKTHERLATYFVGVLGGAVIYDHSLSPWSIPKPWRRLPFILGVLFMGIKSQSMGLKFYDPNINTTPMTNALYASLSRPVFAVAIVSIVVLISVSDESEFHHKFFKPRWAQPLARLTYGVYLIHNILQSYDIGVARNAKTFSIHNAIWDFVPDVVFSFLSALILAIVVEGPFRRIEKRLITNRSQNHNTSLTEKTPMVGKKSNHGNIQTIKE